MKYNKHHFISSLQKNSASPYPINKTPIIKVLYLLSHPITHKNIILMEGELK